jgi:hypothetical protein
MQSQASERSKRGSSAEQVRVERAHALESRPPHPLDGVGTPSRQSHLCSCSNTPHVEIQRKLVSRITWCTGGLGCSSGVYARPVACIPINPYPAHTWLVSPAFEIRAPPTSQQMPPQAGLPSDCWSGSTWLGLGAPPVPAQGTRCRYICTPICSAQVPGRRLAASAKRRLVAVQTRLHPTLQEGALLPGRIILPAGQASCVTSSHQPFVYTSSTRTVHPCRQHGLMGTVANTCDGCSCWQQRAACGISRHSGCAAGPRICMAMVLSVSMAAAGAQVNVTDGGGSILLAVWATCMLPREPENCNRWHLQQPSPIPARAGSHLRLAAFRRQQRHFGTGRFHCCGHDKSQVQ